MQKKSLISKELKDIKDAKDKEREDLSFKLYIKLHDLGKKIPASIYGNTDRLIKMLGLIKNIKDLLDKYFSKRISTLSPKDLEKLKNLHTEVVALNTQIEKNNYDQFKVIEVYMNDFLEQINFINSSITAVSKLNTNIKTSSTVSKSELSDLEDKLEKISTSLSEKNQLRKDIHEDLKQFKIKELEIETSFNETNDIIKSKQLLNETHEDEDKKIEEIKKNIKELNEKKKKKEEEYIKYDNEYNELLKKHIELSNDISKIKGKKGGNKTKKRRKH